jgi:hypothetical protein
MISGNRKVKRIFFRMLSSNKNQQLLPYHNLFGERYEVSDTLLMNFIGIDGIL